MEHKAHTNTESIICATLNESLRWPKYNCKLPQVNGKNLFNISTQKLGIFPPDNETSEEYENRINIYKMNRRKRYLAAQQECSNRFSSNITLYGKHADVNDVTGNRTSSARKLSSSSNGITITPITVLPNTFSKQSCLTSNIEQTKILDESDNLFKASNLNHLKPIMQQNTLSASAIVCTSDGLSHLNTPSKFSLAVSSMAGQSRAQEVVV